MAACHRINARSGIGTSRHSKLRWFKHCAPLRLLGDSPRDRGAAAITELIDAQAGLAHAVGICHNHVSTSALKASSGRWLCLTRRQVKSPRSAEQISLDSFAAPQRGKSSARRETRLQRHNSEPITSNPSGAAQRAQEPAIVRELQQRVEASTHHTSSVRFYASGANRMAPVFRRSYPHTCLTGGAARVVFRVPAGLTAQLISPPWARSLQGSRARQRGTPVIETHSVVASGVTSGGASDPEP